LKLFAALLCCSCCFAASTVIQNATVMTVTKGTYTGSIVIENGKITAAGPNLPIPAGAIVVDAKGKWVIPGIIDCHSHIAAESINEGSVSVAAMVGIEDVLNPEDIAIYRALAGGVTSANILHGSADSIGGKCELIKLRWGKDAEGLKFQGGPPEIKFALGENPKRRGESGFGSGPQNLRYPATRMGVEDVIREAFTEAKAYQASWKEYEDKKAQGKVAIPPARDLKLEPLVEVMEGKRIVNVHCYRQDEILMILRVAHDFNFKPILQHVLEGYKVADEIAAAGATASTFSDWWSYKVEAYDAIPWNAALMARKGIIVSLNSDDAELMRHLNTEAAKAMKYGDLTRDEALAMVTINPAKQLHVDKLVGSIEPGKDADLAIYDGDPLSTLSKVTQVYIDGELYFDRDKDLTGRPEIEKERKLLITKASDRAKQDAKNAKKDMNKTTDKDKEKPTR
jgi:imidazolonepropionase-like amidohydrolase